MRSHTHRAPSETLRLRYSPGLLKHSQLSLQQHVLFSNLVKHVLLVKDYLHATFEVPKFSRFWATPAKKNGQNFFFNGLKKWKFFTLRELKRWRRSADTRQAWMLATQMRMLCGVMSKKMGHQRNCSSQLRQPGAPLLCHSEFSSWEHPAANGISSTSKQCHFLIWPR